MKLIMIGKAILPTTYTAWKVSKYGVFSGPHFPAFGLNTERYEVSLRIQSECGKIRTRKYSVFGHISHSVICTLLFILRDFCCLWTFFKCYTLVGFKKSLLRTVEVYVQNMNLNFGLQISKTNKVKDNVLSTRYISAGYILAE